jgi:hypothetical protein
MLLAPKAGVLRYTLFAYITSRLHLELNKQWLCRQVRLEAFKPRISQIFTDFYGFFLPQRQFGTQREVGVVGEKGEVVEQH